MPSDPRGDIYGARLWAAGGNWTSSFPLTPRDFASFPVPAAPGGLFVSSLGVPSVFPTYSLALREEDEVGNQGNTSSVAMTASPSFSVDALATASQINVNPGDSLKVAFVTTSLGNALDGVSATASDQFNWIVCSHSFIHVLDPSQGAVDSVEI